MNGINMPQPIPTIPTVPPIYAGPQMVYIEIRK